MSAIAQGLPLPFSGKLIWTGRILSGLVVAFLLFDGIFKLLPMQPVTDAFEQLGISLKLAVLIAVVELACAILYAIPRTAVLGAVLLMGLLGGCITTHLRIGSPLFSHTLFSVYFGIMMWGGLYLRDPRVRALLPFRS